MLLGDAVSACTLKSSGLGGYMEGGPTHLCDHHRGKKKKMSRATLTMVGSLVKKPRQHTTGVGNGVTVVPHLPRIRFQNSGAGIHEGREISPLVSRNHRIARAAPFQAERRVDSSSSD